MAGFDKRYHIYDYTVGRSSILLTRVWIPYGIIIWFSFSQDSQLCHHGWCMQCMNVAQSGMQCTDAAQIGGHK